MIAPAPVTRYLVVPCEAPDCRDLAVIWDTVEEQVVDVLTLDAARRYTGDDL